MDCVTSRAVMIVFEPLEAIDMSNMSGSGHAHRIHSPTTAADINTRHVSTLCAQARSTAGPEPVYAVEFDSGSDC